MAAIYLTIARTVINVNILHFWNSFSHNQRFRGSLSARMKRILCFVFVILVISVTAQKNNEEEKPAWTRKKITDYSDADLERLLDQWNVSLTFSLEFLAYSSHLSLIATLMAGRRRRRSR